MATDSSASSSAGEGGSSTATGVSATATGGSGSHTAIPVEPLRLTTPRGAAVDVLQDRPPGPGPFPAVVLGSGAGYTMKLPILERVAQALVAQGIAVFRFDWAYHVRDPEHGVQSKDRAPEIEDMSAVLALARKQPWVDASRIAVGGKSLGSIIAWRVLRATPDLKGALLLSPYARLPGRHPSLLTPTIPT